MKISICIPTLNRPQYLMEGIKSIYNQQHDSFDFEVCISNNASDADYSEVDDFIHACNLKYKNIKYHIHKNRLPLDEHMHFVTKMASGDYIYYLGDDDYFNNDALIEIRSLCEQDVDLSIFNGNLVDKNGKLIGQLFGLQAGKLLSIDDAFFKLRDKGSFGAVLVKRKLLKDLYFTSLYGTSHAYGCYWLYILNNIDEPFNIVIPSKKCVNLRMAEKSYNEAMVYYSDIVNEFLLYDKNINNDRGRKLNNNFFEIYKKRIFSIRWMAAMFSRGARFSGVYKFDKKIDLLFFLKKIISFGIGKFFIYSYMKSFYQKIK